MEAAHIYLVVSGISFLFLGMYNTGAAILRCQEDTKTSMMVSFVMNIVNVVFNAWFVFGLHMGVLGIAVATLISRALAGIVGQDIGAGDKKLAVSDAKRLLKLAYIGDWTCKLLLFAVAPYLVSIFSLSATDTDMATTVLRCFAVASLPVWPLSFTLPNALRGAGDAKYTMIVSILSM